MTLEEAIRVFAAFASEDVEYVVIGSMAMAAQGLPRATQDLDFFVSPREGSVRPGGRLMGLKKYRSMQEIPPVAPRKPLDPGNLRIACELSELARAMHPRVLPAGVTKFRSASERPADVPDVRTHRP